MRYYILFAVIGLFCIAGSKDKRPAYVSVNRVRAGQELDRAKDTTFQFFFDSRMRRLEKKYMMGPDDVLLETDSFIYFGFIHDTVLWRFYKVRKNEVVTRFPGYKTFNGDDVRKVVDELFSSSPPKEKKHAGYVYLDSRIIYDYRILYKDSGILVKFQGAVSDPVWHTPNRTKKIKDSVLLSKTDLSRIQ